ncbi:MAG: hypothetical protein ACR2OJ_11650 [Hyphomicrobiales bacterium]
MSASNSIGARISDLKREAEAISKSRSKQSETENATEQETTAFERLDVERIEEQLSEFTDLASEEIEQLAETAEQQVKAHPLLALALAFTAGIVLGRLLK